MRMIESEDVEPNMEGPGRPSVERLLGNGCLARTDIRARARGARASVTDGPFAETKEMIGRSSFPTVLSY